MEPSLFYEMNQTSIWTGIICILSGKVQMCCSSERFREKVGFGKNNKVVFCNGTKCGNTKVLKPNPFTCRSMFPGSSLTWARPWERGHVWTTPDMTGCLAISIRANESWEKADRLTLQIGASGVKFQEYVNYLNWSGDGFPDNQFDQADDHVTCIALHGDQTGRLRNW